jgi:hypothetical protein
MLVSTANALATCVARKGGLRECGGHFSGWNYPMVQTKGGLPPAAGRKLTAM